MECVECVKSCGDCIGCIRGVLWYGVGCACSVVVLSVELCIGWVVRVFIGYVQDVYSITEGAFVPVCIGCVYVRV